nr:MAG TPA: hypothetical protein [Caudoviricetes sp.]
MAKHTDWIRSSVGQCCVRWRRYSSNCLYSRLYADSFRITEYRRLSGKSLSRFV